MWSDDKIESTVRVRFVRTHANAKLPTKGTDGAVGWDLYACIDRPLELWPGKVLLVPTGWNIAVPDGYEAQVRSRSGLALKHCVFVLNSPGTIDPDYRGGLGVILYNSRLTWHPSDNPLKYVREPEVYVIEPGARIAQLVIAPVTPAAMVEVEEFGDSTARGTGGYGSTGH